ncbi:MAG: hypothetical protein MJ240_12255 [Kiritimatiellae bacterium]|nr:hypothetical protein [Kiritimatiellia bacterium]
MSRSVFSIIVLFVACVVYPFAIIWLRETRPGWMQRGRCCLFVVGALLVSWGVSVGAVFIPYELGWWTFRGPEAAFAMFFGWLYLPLMSIPVLGTYAVVRSLSSRRADTSCGVRGKRRIGFWFLMALVLFAGFVVWCGTGDAVERQFKWLYKMPDFKYEVLQREEDIVHEYRVPVRFLQALQKEDMSRHGFSSWQGLQGGMGLGGHKVNVGFSESEGPVYVSRQMTYGGVRELHAAVIAFSIKEGRLVLYCPRF